MDADHMYSLASKQLWGSESLNKTQKKKAKELRKRINKLCNIRGQVTPPEQGIVQRKRLEIRSKKLFLFPRCKPRNLQYRKPWCSFTIEKKHEFRGEHHNVLDKQDHIYDWGLEDFFNDKRLAYHYDRHAPEGCKKIIFKSDKSKKNYTEHIERDRSIKRIVWNKVTIEDLCNPIFMAYYNAVAEIDKEAYWFKDLKHLELTSMSDLQERRNWSLYTYTSDSRGSQRKNKLELKLNVIMK